MTKRSPLIPYFVSLGASLTTRGDWEVAEGFSDWEEEYRAANEAVIVSDRSYRGRVSVQGRDRVVFLHNMLSNDIKTLQTGTGCRAAFLSQKGKLITDMIVYRREDSIHLEMEPERVGGLLEALSRYIVADDVELEDVSDREVLISVEGPSASDFLSTLLDQPLPELEPYHSMQNVIADVPVRLSAARHGPERGFDMLIPTERGVTIVERMVSQGAGVGMRLAGYRVLETRRIEAGIPLLGVDMDESHMLLETGLDDAVSFNKGCYIGQEYVARLAHRGHLNRKLVGLKLVGDAVPSPRDDIMGDGRHVGQVTSATYSPRLGIPIAMGYVHRDFFEPGTDVAIRIGDSVAPARVANLPFLSRNEDIHTDR